MLRKAVSEMARCRGCIHYEVCAKEGRMVQVDEHTWDDYNQLDNVECFCENYISTADVVPRAEWISVEERLPESNTRCVVWSFDYIWRVRFAFYNVCTKRWYVVCDDQIKDTKRDGVKVTHWMPLPEPPKTNQ